MPPRIMISAGEASADHHAAALITSLIRLRPDWSFYGMGGPAMTQAGFEAIYDSSVVNTMGFVEVLPALGRILKVMGNLKQRIRMDRPDALILIDLPDFNMRLLKTAHRAGVPVIYYIPPQLWAWRRGRIKSLARYVDQMIVIFPFEEEFYQRYGVKVFYSGHPFADMEPIRLNDSIDFRTKIGLDNKTPLIGILPGSRKSELNTLMDTFVDAAKEIKRRRPEVEFVLPLAPTLSREDITNRLHGLKVYLTDQPVRQVLPSCRAALVCSGTATLEAAIAGTPSVVSYKSTKLGEIIVRLIVSRHVEHAAMPNLIAGKTVMPELLGDAATPQTLADHLISLMDEGPKRENVLNDLDSIRNKLGEPGAAERTAHKIIEVVAGRSA